MSQDQHLLLRHCCHRPRYAANPVTRLTPSREWHPIGAKCGVIVDQDGRRIEAPRGPHDGPEICRKHTGLKSEGQRVGDFDRLIKFLESIDAGHGTEYLELR